MSSFWARRTESVEMRQTGVELGKFVFVAGVCGQVFVRSVLFNLMTFYLLYDACRNLSLITRREWRDR